jgi:Histidine kinase-like ATPase domain
MTDQLTDPVAALVSLAFPCRPEYVALCRLVAGALGARDGLDEEVVADVKVIVTEACGCLLAMASDTAAGAGACAGTAGTAKGAADPSCHIRMDFDSRPGAFVISVLYPDKRELLSWLEGCDPVSQAGLGLTILKALTDEIVELPDAEGTILRLTKRLPA